MRGDMEKVLEAGCNAYFEKPIDPLTIVDKIHKALGL
jgi:two-component system cell cycle response regulator DivK